MDKNLSISPPPTSFQESLVDIWQEEFSRYASLEDLTEAADEAGCFKDKTDSEWAFVAKRQLVSAQISRLKVEVGEKTFRDGFIVENDEGQKICADLDNTMRHHPDHFVTKQQDSELEAFSKVGEASAWRVLEDYRTDQLDLFNDDAKMETEAGDLTSPAELLMKDLLTEIAPDFIHHDEVGARQPDFVSHQRKIVIEVDGFTIHAKSANKFIETSRRNLDHYKNAYEVLVFPATWLHEANMDTMKKTVEKVLTADNRLQPSSASVAQ
tara:strand:+ start:437 stop:1240 length:804 start_codon:yes stop_codon:yes gene_type:complete